MSFPPYLRRSSSRLIACLLAFLCAGLLGTAPVHSQAGSGGTPTLSFDLADQFGTRWRSGQLTGKSLVLVLGSRAHAERMKPWSDSLQHALAADTASVRWFMVADLRSVPSFMRRMASQRAPREAHRILLLDGEGTVASQLGADKKALTVIVLDRERHVKLRLTDVSPTRDQVRLVRDMVAR
ncbi:MAG: hypothetical protein MUD17_06250 [Gemmatimonadaceae bacterium]|jgi:predicted transcriptional regulator|nr:hypothetical protein [Gemmatimonadaceae bacterium]